MYKNLMNRKTFFKQIGLVAGGCLCLPFISLATPKKRLQAMSSREWCMKWVKEVYQNHLKGVTPLVNPEEYNKYMRKANLEYFKKIINERHS